MSTVPQTDGHWPLGVKAAKFNGRTVIGCECGALPKAPPTRMSMQHVWHQTHRRGFKLQPVNYEWPDDRYMDGLSTGGYVQVRGHKWQDGRWVLADQTDHTSHTLSECLRHGEQS
jgi:hypothetical protein